MHYKVFGGLVLILIKDYNPGTKKQKFWFWHQKSHQKHKVVALWVTYYVGNNYHYHYHPWVVLWVKLSIGDVENTGKYLVFAEGAAISWVSLDIFYWCIITPLLEMEVEYNGNFNIT